MKNECENYLCIYEKENNCTLEQITLDITGACTDCMYVEIKKEELERLKKATINGLKRRYKK